MRPRKRFLQFLADSLGRTYERVGYDSRGIPRIVASTSPSFLKSSAIGWLDNSISFIRSNVYYGINRSFSIPLKFVNDGADIIKNRVYQKGYEDKLRFIMNKWNGVTSDVYDPYFAGEIDMTEIKQQSDGVTVNVIEGGALKMLNANQNVKYKIPVDETNAESFKVLLDGTNLKDLFNYQAVDVKLQNVGFTIPLSFVNNEGDNVNVVGSDQSYEELPIGLAGYLASSSNYFFKAFTSTELRVTGKLVVYNYETNTTPCEISIYKNDATKYELFDGAIPAAPVFDNPVPFEIEVDVTIPLEDEESVFLTFIQVGGDVINFKDSFLKLDFVTKKEQSTTFAIKASTLFKNLVEKITEGNYTCTSPLFDEIDNIAYTCGDALRNTDRAVVPNYYLEISFADFFADMNANEMCGVSVKNNVIILSRRGDLYNSSSVTMDIGEVANYEISVAKDYIVNTIKYGYPDQDYDQRSGKYEFNTEVESKMPVTVVNNEYNIRASSRADWLGIEILRSQFTSLDDKDNEGDKQCFMLVITDQQDAEGNFLLSRPDYSSITGVLDNTVYNTEISPKRQLLKHGSWLRSIVYFSLLNRINFGFSKKNENLTTTIGGVTVSERANIRVDSLPAPMFYPYIFQFETEVPANFIDIMNNAVNGHIAFKINGRQFYGFPLEVSVKPALNDKQVWKVLASPVNDVTLLQNLEPDPLNTLNMATYGVTVPYLNPVQFLPVGVVFPSLYHYKEMNSDFFVNCIQDYSVKKNYFQKWQKNDIIQVQCITNGLGPVQLDLVDCNLKSYGVFPMSLVSDPAVGSPYALYQTNVTLNDLEEGLYYILMTAGTGGTKAQFISEGLKVKEDWPRTLLYKYKSSINKLETIFTSGFYPTIRVEGTLVNFKPSAKYTSYEDEPLDLELIEGIPTQNFELKIGLDNLVPDYIIDKINRVLTLDETYVDGFKIARTSDEFEVERIPGRADAFWTLPIRASLNRMGNTLTVDGELNKAVAVIYQIDNSYFADLSGQVSANVIQITNVEQQ